MTEPGRTPPQEETSEDRFEHQIEELEGVGAPRKWGWWIVVGILLAGIAAVLIFVKPPPKTPAASAAKGVPQLDLTLPRPGTLASPPAQFRWESVSGRFNYSFRLNVLGSQTPLVDRTVRESTLDLTPEETARLTKGRSYVWEVAALTKQGTKLAAGQSYFDL